MRRIAYHQDRRDVLDVAMTPMIDVVFLLLIFFVWTASFQVVEHLLPARLISTPGRAEASRKNLPPPPDFEPVVVQVLWQDGRPAWLVNDVPLASLDELQRTLQAVARIKSDVPLIVDPGREVPLGDVIDVYDISRLAGFEKIQFAASEEI